MNQLVTEQAGGALIFKGTVNEPATVTVGGKPATRHGRQPLRGPGRGAVRHGPGGGDGDGPERQRAHEHVPGQPERREQELHLRRKRQHDRRRDEDLRVGRREPARRRSRQGATTLASFAYNRDGIRTSKTVGGATTRYVLEGSSVVEERAAAGDDAALPGSGHRQRAGDAGRRRRGQRTSRAIISAASAST